MAGAIGAIETTGTRETFEQSFGSGLKDVIRRDLPAAPAYLRPVAVPEPKAGENALSVAARERAGRLKANTVIRSARAQWEKLRAAYKASK